VLIIKKIIDAINLTKKFGTKTKFLALDGINFEVNEGDFIGIMGPSGSGKTTLLNMISTIDIPSSGQVEINGSNVASMPERELSKFRYENIGFIFQEFNLINTITMAENIAIPLSLSNKLSKKEIRDKAIEMAKRIGIKDIVDKYPTECSGGQRQRVAIARALANNPSIIVADEPTGNLDSKNSHDLLKLLKELNEKENKTIVLVTHDSMIASYTKSLVFLRDGKIENILHRENLSQKDFFYKIIDITSKESQNLFDTIEKAL
jgi:putative ABC transport system ATP-binding protein